MEEELRQRIHDLEYEKEDLNIHIQHLEQDFEQERDELNAKLVKEKEKNKKLEKDVQEMRRVIETYEDDIADTRDVSKDELKLYVEKISERDKVIDLMVEDILERQESYRIIRRNYECGAICDKNCIKEYYFKKARGEKL